MIKRLTAYFSGTVQGVGFRFTAERLARDRGVTGFVKNLPDGRVELVAEGEEEIVKDFLDRILHSQLSLFIRNVQTAWSEAGGRFKSFGISH